MSKKEAKGLKVLTDIKKAIEETNRILKIGIEAIVKELDEIKDAVNFIQVSV